MNNINHQNNIYIKDLLTLYCFNHIYVSTKNKEAKGVQLTFIIILTLFSIFLIINSKKVKTESDFTLAGRGLNTSKVSFVIIGTLVGGASTVGTVQLAYTYGVAAWIFTLFSGIACLILGLFFAKALRLEEVTTVSEFIGNKLGKRFQTYTSFFSSFGMYIHIVAQFLAAMSIIETIFTSNKTISLPVTFILILIFVISGGVMASSSIGKIKVYLLYGLMIISAYIAITKQNGILNLIHSIPDKRMLSLFSYGTFKASKDMFAMVIGVLSTQTYLQAIFSAKDVKTARNGAFLSAALIPPIGIFGIIVGIYMRIHHPELSNNTTVIFPYFIKLYFNPFVAAIFMASLTVIILGTAAGLTLGVTTNIYIDILKNSKINKLKIGEMLKLKITALIVLLTSSLIVITGLDSKILDWSYMSMGIRGSAIFIPMLLIMAIKDKKTLKRLKPFIAALPIIYIITSLILK